jgi:hypothetical protein
VESETSKLAEYKEKIDHLRVKKKNEKKKMKKKKFFSLCGCLP